MSETRFVSATPVLASLDIQRSVDFFSDVLGFDVRHAEQGVYGVVTRGAVGIHFWACDDRRYPENTSCRIRVEGIEALHDVCLQAGFVHPRAPMSTKPWGSREFGILDPDGNLITFAEWEGE
jgi:catechol 2,3-dioxygenase-like lactoylglutathione lyase family enzyme